MARMQIASMPSYWLEPESWAGKCGRNWRARFMVPRRLLRRTGTAESRIVAVTEG